jgi:alpha-tubulin suppressor-like RCC1 family protein
MEKGAIIMMHADDVVSIGPSQKKNYHGDLIIKHDFIRCRYKTILVLCLLSLVSGCGPGQLISPTITPTPTYTPALTYTPTQTLTPTNSPTSTPLPPKITFISSGYNHTCAVINNGGVICWGKNDYGQLGDGTTVDHSSPVKVNGLKGNVVSLSLGENNSCALTGAGEVWCWGGAVPPKTIRIEGLGDGVKAVSVGRGHTCAITAGGGVKCWGANYSGELGDGTATNRDSPVDVVGLISGVKEIGTGDGRTCALTDSGGVKCWGTYWEGPEGVVVTGDYQVVGRKELSRPVEIVGLTGVQSMAVGSDHVCVITENGGVRCWGKNEYGQLGDGTNDNPGLLRSYKGWPPVPNLVDVAGLSGGVQGLFAGYSHTCVWLEVGTVKCWGKNDRGQLGNSTTIDSNVPVDAVGLQSGITMVAGGENHTCALTAEGKGKCWGSNSSGQLGVGTILMRREPVEVPGLGNGVKSVSSSREFFGVDHTCAVTVGGGVKCWGANEYGQLGDGTITQRGSPVDVIGLSAGVQVVASGSYHTCALTDEGDVKCWGAMYGDEPTVGGSYGTEPIEIDGLDGEVIAIAAGDDHTCALTETGGVQCWGFNYDGQLGNGGNTDSFTPVEVFGLAKGVSAITAGYGFTCALKEQGGVKCWGSNRYYQLGEGKEPCYNDKFRNIKKPVDVFGLSSGIKTISAGIYIACGVTDNGGVKCWGWWPPGVLDRSSKDCNKPGDVIVLEKKVSAVAVGDEHICGIIASGGVQCWGSSNAYGQLGNGYLERFVTPQTPRDVIGLSKDVIALTAGKDYSCALTKEGRVKCWGSDNYGQLGQGTILLSPTPVNILFPVG